MKVLVTGGAGFIGSNFVHYWVKNYPTDNVRVLDNLTYAGNIENLKSIRKKIEFIKGDIVDRSVAEKAMQGIDVVVHFAAESHVDKSVLNPEEFQRTNVIGTKILLEEAEKAKVFRFHHISTDEVYGELALDSKEKFTEKTPYAPRPDNFYAISKAEADLLVKEFWKRSKMNITISNCSNNYGPFQFPEKFVPIAITNLIDGMKVPVHGDGLNVRDWIHTEDHSSAIDLIIKKGTPKEVYLIGSNNDWSNESIAEKIAELFGKDKNWIKHVPNRHSNDRRYAIDATKIRKELGWKPKFSRKNFEDGLKETIKWYKENEDWWRPLLDRKAQFSDKSKKVVAFMSLDRVLGRTIVTYKSGNGHFGKGKEKLLRKVAGDKNKTEIVLRKIKTKNWYKNSGKAIKKEILKLAKNPRTVNFVDDLANRPESINATYRQLKVTKIERATDQKDIYGISVWFEVEEKDNRVKEEGYYSWGMGPISGAKVLLLLKKKKKITHVGLFKESKFPVGSKVYSLIGGFSLLNESIYDLISRKLYVDVGIDVTKDDVQIEEVIGLGRMMPDSGMTNNHPLLYGVVLKVNEKLFPNMKKGVSYEGEDGMVLWPVEKLEELVNRVDDSYTLAALSRMFLGGINKIKL